MNNSNNDDICSLCTIKQKSAQHLQKHLGRKTACISNPKVIELLEKRLKDYASDSKLDTELQDRYRMSEDQAEMFYRLFIRSQGQLKVWLEKLLVLSNFFFCHLVFKKLQQVFKKLPLQRLQKASI